MKIVIEPNTSYGNALIASLGLIILCLADTHPDMVFIQYAVFVIVYLYGFFIALEIFLFVLWRIHRENAKLLDDITLQPFSAYLIGRQSLYTNLATACVFLTTDHPLMFFCHCVLILMRIEMNAWYEKHTPHPNGVTATLFAKKEGES